jgi:hypothetical protein
LIDRLMARAHLDVNGCWIWGGYCNRDGYGKIKDDGGRRLLSTHRVTYEHFVEPIPDGLQIDHLCRNRACCNPAHLEPVTSRENTMRGRTLASINAMLTHCRKGHPFDEANTRMHGGGRRCRACAREWAQRRKRAA